MNERFIYFFCLVFALIFIGGGLQVRETILSSAFAQEANTRELIRWKSAYQALKHINNTWKKEFVPLGEVNDLVGLYRRFDMEETGLKVDRKTLRVSDISQVKFDGRNLGLARICVDGERGRGLAARERSASALLNGVQRLEQRRDVEFSGATLSSDDNGVKLTVNNLCFLLRE